MRLCVLPSDFLFPFSEFVEKYSLQDLAYSVYFQAQGVTNFLDQLTVNVFKYVDGSFLDALSGGDVVPSNHNNWEIFVKASALLGSDILLSSTVVSTQGSTNGTGVSLVVQTPTGRKFIQASQLLISIPPLLGNMHGLPIQIQNLGRIQWEVNFRGTYLMTRAFVPLLLEGAKKTIANMASITAFIQRPWRLGLLDREASSLTLTELTVTEYEDQGLVAWAIHPGCVASELTSILPPFAKEKFVDEPALMADTIVWLTQEKQA